MRSDSISVPRPNRRLLLPLLLATGLLAAATPGPAGAWILRYTTGHGLAPNPPVSNQPTTFVLYGEYPTGCGSIVSSTVMDSGHVAIHLRSDATCPPPSPPDSLLSGWIQSFPLGMLSAGNHDLTITLTMDRADTVATVESATFTFGVGDTAIAPPPPPPPILPLVNGCWTVPSAPLTTGPVHLIVTGYTPFACATLSEASVTGGEHAKITMTATTCSDTANTWTHDFDLGLLSAGTHVLDLTVIEVRDTLTTTENIALGYITVVDPSQIPPPPPPPPLVSSWETDPSPAIDTAPVRVLVTGSLPFPCATLSNPTVIDTSHATLTMTQSSCSDLGAWAYAFDLGIMPAGHHVLDLAVVEDSAGVLTTVHFSLPYVVLNPDGLPSPPPPDDSLVTVLSPGRPNPFAAESRFSVSLENGTHASVSVFDVNGRRMRTVFEGRFERGTTQLSWDGRREDGSRAPAGLYFYRLVLPGRVISRRVVLLPTP